MNDIKSVEDIAHLLAQEQYISEPSINVSLFLAHKMQKPLLVEGPPGVGKTEIAKVLARAFQTKLIRLQCYEGLDIHHAVYEWNYQKQLLHLKIAERSQASPAHLSAEIFGESFLMPRPLLQAITHHQPVVLLIDELDRADEAFESYLLELLSDWQITIPEIGTIKASSVPQVVITCNRIRDLSDALRRRCFYLWIDFPTFDKELAIIRTKVPGIEKRLAQEIAFFMQLLREQQLSKSPGISETLDWATALADLHFDHLEPTVIEQTLGIILKDWRDMKQSLTSLNELLEKVKVKSKLDIG